MKAILVSKNGELVWSDVPHPIIGEREVLIKIAAAGLNRADLMQRSGNYPPPVGWPEWMGLEVGGVIVEVGKIANNHRYVGEEVCALLGGGGYAEYVAVDYSLTMPIPKGVSLIEAAALPEAFTTAYLNLFIEGDAKKGETLLMNAGGSGLASVLIPMAKSFGIRVITTVRTHKVADGIGHLGADRVVITSEEDVSRVMKEEREAGRGVNLVIDSLGGEEVAKCIPYMEREGHWIVISTLAGDIAPIDLKALYRNAGKISGNTLRARSTEMKTQILASLVDKIWPLVESGQIRPTIHKILPIQQAETAHAIMQHGQKVGKIILKVT